jgi:predicted lipoprotein with Yx(FWY)xxD motif
VVCRFCTLRGPIGLPAGFEHVRMMIDLKRVVAGVAAALSIAGCAGVAYAPVKYTDGIMVNHAGMTLYTFDKDATGSGKSVCNGQCATNWPPFAAGSTEQSGGDWTVIKRDDGAKQWAWLGKPLYLWAKDQKPGDRTGDGFNNVWHVIKPEPRPPSADSM